MESCRTSTTNFTPLRDWRADNFPWRFLSPFDSPFLNIFKLPDFCNEFEKFDEKAYVFPLLVGFGEIYYAKHEIKIVNEVWVNFFTGRELTAGIKF